MPKPAKNLKIEQRIEVARRFAGDESAKELAAVEERPLLSEIEARLMDPNEVIVLASPQHPIRTSRIKYYDDPFYKEMLARQEGKPFPYPPSVESVGPWGGDDGDDAINTEPTKPTERVPLSRIGHSAGKCGR